MTTGLGRLDVANPEIKCSNTKMIAFIILKNIYLHKIKGVKIIER